VKPSPFSHYATIASPSFPSIQICGLAISVLMASASMPAFAEGADQPAPQQVVNALYSAFGDNHSRAVHAKGIMVEGMFEPASDSLNITKASLFRGHNIPVLARFSDFTGIPEIPDNVGDANPRGFAMKFSLPDGSTADVVTHSFNGFPAGTTEEFRELLMAIGAKHSGQPAPLDNFLASHPIAKTFLTTQKPAPSSYATLSYFGVNAFAFIDAKGRKTFVRYRFIPMGGESFVSPEALAAKGPNYLQAELPTRISKGPVSFEWYAQVAHSPDIIDNPSIAWPENRKLVKLGTIRFDRMVANQVEVSKKTMFTPLNVPAGIESADPMLNARRDAYPLSFVHRQ
jgi:catalase